MDVTVAIALTSPGKKKEEKKKWRTFLYRITFYVMLHIQQLSSCHPFREGLSNSFIYLDDCETRRSLLLDVYDVNRCKIASSEPRGPEDDSTAE